MDGREKCHPERSEGGHADMVPFTSFRMTSTDSIYPPGPHTHILRAMTSGQPTPPMPAGPRAGAALEARGR
jgi:hypothetical protein